jgi:uncharacterized protein YidB (DUF937 family)
MPSLPTTPMLEGITLENIKTATAGIADSTNSESAKLFPEVVKMVQNLPGGVSGLVKQFQDKGLGSVAASLSGTSTNPVSPEQILQGLGTERIEALATASGLDAKVVRKEIAAILPKVVHQLKSDGKVAEATATV